MNKYLTLFGIIGMFFVGMQTTVAQEKTKEQKEYAEKKRELATAQRQAVLSPEVVADQQTETLNQLVNLDEEKYSKVHEIFLAVEIKREKLLSISDTAEKSAMIQQLENDKIKRLKEILKPDQFEKYQNSIPKQ